MKNLIIAISIFAVVFAVAAVSHAHVALDFPVGGETFNEGEEINIRWHIVIPHDLQNWDLYFSDDGGASWQVIELDLPPDQLDYLWTVPGISTTQGRIRIYMDNSGTDYEDQSDDFTIVAASVPTLSEWGMLILGLLLLAAGTAATVRRFRTVQPVRS